MRSNVRWWKWPILGLQDNWACEMDLGRGVCALRKSNSRFGGHTSAERLARRGELGRMAARDAGMCSNLVWHAGLDMTRPNAPETSCVCFIARMASMSAFLPIVSLRNAVEWRFRTGRVGRVRPGTPSASGARLRASLRTTHARSGKVDRVRAPLSIPSCPLSPTTGSTLAVVAHDELLKISRIRSVDTTSIP